MAGDNRKNSTDHTRAAGCLLEDLRPQGPIIVVPDRRWRARLAHLELPRSVRWSRLAIVRRGGGSEGGASLTRKLRVGKRHVTQLF